MLCRTGTRTNTKRRRATAASTLMILFAILCFSKLSVVVFQMQRLMGSSESSESSSSSSFLYTRKNNDKHKDEQINLPTNSKNHHRGHHHGHHRDLAGDLVPPKTKPPVVRHQEPAADLVVDPHQQHQHQQHQHQQQHQQPNKNDTDQSSSTLSSSTISSSSSTPILIWTTMDFNRHEPCDVPCEYTSDHSRRKDADASVYERRGWQKPYAGDKFSIYLQMEGTHYYPIRKTLLDTYDLENSYRWTSSPLLKPYFEWVHYHQDYYNISNPPVSFHDTINGASFIARNCDSLNHRESLVMELRNANIRVDGLSSCLPTPVTTNTNTNTTTTIPRVDRSDKIQMMRPYKFNLAFENGNVENYVTEKVYQALAAGVVPVYMGAPDIRDFVPDGSIINVMDFKRNVTRLAEHLQDCMRNETLYNSYHAWRSKPLPEWFQRKFNFTWVTTECRTCRYMHARRNGWKWDKENQRGIPPPPPPAAATTAATAASSIT